MPVTASSTPPGDDVVHGIRVLDPYRWLEDRSLPTTEQWIRDQQQDCTRYFAQYPALSAIRTRVREYLDVTVVDQPVRIGTRYFYRRRSQGKEQASIYVRDAETEKETVLVTAPPDSFDSVRIHQVSRRGTLLAYELRHGGTDRRSIQVVDVKNGNTLDTAVEADWFRGLVFGEVARGFFYCQDLTHGAEHAVRWHSFKCHVHDPICFRAPKTALSRLILTYDEAHLGVIYLDHDGENEVLDFWIAKLDDMTPLSWHRVFHKQRLPFSPVLSHGRIFAKTHDDAGNGRYAEFDRDGHALRTVIPVIPGRVCQVMTVQGGFVVNHFHEGQFETRYWSFEGEDRGTLSMPANTTVTLLPPLASAQHTLFLTCESFNMAPTLYEFFAADGTTQVRHASSMSERLPCIAIEKTHYASRDGMNIPITLVSARQDAGQRAPCLMTAYGGFSVPATPQRSVLVNILLELGVRFALPHIRGGGDFGPTWHEAGRRRQRQTSINDFLAAGDWLYEQDYVSHHGLAIFGGSNSGLLVGAAITQRPDLFRAALCIAPLLDMVRYERFDRAERWASEYGTVREEADFLALYGYSPYHHVRDAVNYPATLFVTGDNDDRCDPAHVRKMVAALQNRTVQTNPILVDYSVERGHTPVLPLSVRIDALARRVAFFCQELDLIVSFKG